MKQLLYILTGITVLHTAACRKYVEIPAENVRELKYTRDYQALLNNSFSQLEKSYFYPLFASDEVFTADGSVWQNNLNINAANSYCWLPKVWGETQEDADWAGLYKSMYIVNTVTTEVMGSTEGTEAGKRKLYAEALVHRAFLYYTLVNIYANQYEAATAETDAGVPVLLSTDLFASLQRAPVAKVYDQVMKDLQEALPELPELPGVNTAPSKAAVFSMMARVYLNKREFANAGRFADSALKIKSSLIDLNAYVSAAYPTKTNDAEIIFSKAIHSFIAGLPLHPETLNLFDSTVDLRFSLFTKPGTQIAASNFVNRGYYKHRLVNQGIYTGPGVPEMMLIKAESEARAGHTGNAIAILNSLRKKRYTLAGYYDLAAATPQEALIHVINERRRELLGTGMRWFDQRRLQKDKDYNFVKTVSRPFKGTTYTLEPGSSRYVFAIADKYIKLNPEIEQNPR
jgi:starch-binding outer membrane protein, SusD/RagB family